MNIRNPSLSFYPQLVHEPLTVNRRHGIGGQLSKHPNRRRILPRIPFGMQAESTTITWVPLRIRRSRFHSGQIFATVLNQTQILIYIRQVSPSQYHIISRRHMVLLRKPFTVAARGFGIQFSQRTGICISQTPRMMEQHGRLPRALAVQPHFKSQVTRLSFKTATLT